MGLNKEKQIKEIAFELENHTYMSQFQAEIASRMLYTLGYRKTSEVAREIFDEIDRMIYKVLNDRHYIMGDMCYEVAELKKKYTEEWK